MPDTDDEMSRVDCPRCARKLNPPNDKINTNDTLCRESGQLECIAEIERLTEAIRLTLEENCHLADGDNCTLLRLKRAYAQNDQAQRPPKENR